MTIGEDIAGAEDRAAAALLAGIAPRDGVEAALAAQMAACHEAALACLGNARREDLPQSARTGELRTGTRLMGLFTQQLGALERHRTHLRREREAAESAERDAELRRKFAQRDAEREAEEALLFPSRASRLSVPPTDEAIFERLCQRFERRMSGEGVEADPAPVPDAAGAAASPPPAAPEAPLSRQQRRALERLGRKARRRAGAG